MSHARMPSVITVIISANAAAGLGFQFKVDSYSIVTYDIYVGLDLKARGVL